MPDLWVADAGGIVEEMVRNPSHTDPHTHTHTHTQHTDRPNQPLSFSRFTVRCVQAVTSLKRERERERERGFGWV